MFEVKHNLKTATFLRKLGYSHKQIAQHLGCSESWCRHNLAGVQEDKKLMKECMEGLIYKYGAF